MSTCACQVTACNKVVLRQERRDLPSVRVDTAVLVLLIFYVLFARSYCSLVAKRHACFVFKRACVTKMYVPYSTNEREAGEECTPSAVPYPSLRELPTPVYTCDRMCLSLFRVSGTRNEPARCRGCHRKNGEIRRFLYQSYDERRTGTSGACEYVFLANSVMAQMYSQYI